MRFAKQQGATLLHSHGYKGNILFGLLPRSVRPMPMVATLHGWTWTGGFSRMRLYEWLDARALHKIDRVVLVNAAMQSHPRLQGYLQQRIRVIENGIPCSAEVKLASAASLDQAIVDFCSKTVTIGAVGRLSPEKGFDLLIDAVAAIREQGRDLQLVIMGEGALRPALEDQIKKRGLEQQVLLPGYRAHGEHYLQLFTLFAMPSLTEGLPMVLLEAMRAKTPIIASSVGGIPHVLDQGVCGILVPAGQPQPLADAIIKLLDNPDQAATQAAFAYQRLVQRYSSTAMAQKYLDMYREVVS
jgi:glycosyltransferase involved in cell wall biosynthesis